MQNIISVLNRYLSHINMPSVNIIDVIEILLISVFVYQFMVWIKYTRAYTLLKGLLIISAFLLVAYIFKMNTILWIVSNLSSVLIMAVIVIFQPELRKIVEQLGQKRIMVKQLVQAGCEQQEVIPAHVTENQVTVQVPENLTAEVAKSTMWEEYNSRCINCGRCNFVCPTCTCFTMQDLFYSENGKVGERRRIWASCMVDGFTDVAGGGSYRKKNGERMRFKVLHKVLDYKQRNGYHMCVGCGRCDDICPEYISFSGCINKLQSAMTEVTEQ